MFGKNLLNLVSLLFIGSQFISNAWAEKCEYAGTSTIEINGSAACDGSSYLINNAGNAKVDDPTNCKSGGSECTLITCPNDTQSCNKGNAAGTDVSGYVTISNKLLTCTDSICTYVDTTSGGAYVNALENKPIKCTSDNCVTKSDCAAVGDVMYSEGNYLCLTSNGSKKIEIASGNVKIYHYLTVGNGATNPITGATNDSTAEKILIVTGNGKTEIGSIGSFTENIVDYLVNDVDGTLSNEGKAVAVTYDGSNLVLKAGITGSKEYCVDANSVILGTREAFCSNVKCTNGYYLCSSGVCERQDNIECPSSVDCKTNESIPAQGGCTTPGYYLTTKSDNNLQVANTAGKLYLCSAYNCKEETSPKIGYYQNSGINGDYIRCDGTDCKAITATATSTGCDESGVQIGDLINLSTTTIKICYGTGAGEGVALDIPGKVIISLAAGNNLGRSANTYVFDIADNQAFIQINASNDEYFIQSKLQAFALETNPASEGTLLNCAEDTGICSTETAKIGYYKNAGSDTVPYIKCDIKCYPYVPVVTESGKGCDATNDSIGSPISPAIAIGDVIKDDANYKLCLGTSARTDGITLDATSASYFISIATSNIYGNKASNYVLVNLANGNALRDDLTAANIPRYRYTNDKFKESTKDEENMCDGNNPGTKIQEFKYNKCDSEADTTTTTKQVNYYEIVTYGA